MTTTLSESNLPGLSRIHRGKVRDVYALPDERLLMVATDRLSAFDVILPDPIPGKGEILTQMSNFWFALTESTCPNHLTGVDPVSVLPEGTDTALYRRRSVVARRLKPVPVEAIARGYLIGSGWKEYQARGSVCGIALPAGIEMAGELSAPIFTPSTKAAVGDHDENIGFDRVVELVGADLAEQVRTFEAAVKPGALGWNWAMFAYKGWLRLSWLDENVMSKIVPDELFYNVCITGTKPAVNA